MWYTQRSLVPARGKSSRTASYYHYLYLSLKGGAESSQFQDHAQSPIYLFTVTRRERAHTIIHNQKINTTSVSKPEVLFVFLFAFWGQLSGYSEPSHPPVLSFHVHASLLSKAASTALLLGDHGLAPSGDSECVTGSQPCRVHTNACSLPTVPSPGSAT